MADCEGCDYWKGRAEYFEKELKLLREEFRETRGRLEDIEPDYKEMKKNKERAYDDWTTTPEGMP